MFVKLYEKLAKIFRKPHYNYFASQVNHSHAKNRTELEKQLKKTKIKPGQCIFFWNRRTKCVDHIAIVPSQNPNNLNLLQAKIVHAAPPLTIDNSDFSGVRVSSALKFIGNLNKTYSRILVGSPPTASSLQLQKAGELTREIGISKKIDNKVILYSLPIANKFCYVKWFDFDTHLKFKIGFPYLVAKKETGTITGWMSTYCGDLVGRIYQQIKIKNLPKANFMGRMFFRSSTFYEWMKANDSIEDIVMWNDPTPNKY